ncbi:hypothetical protein C8A05DRAFT_48143 [Staphylotrichum tortipilum]|uniref:FAD/NAD(P)-binding domain-containing protein n=1 Tax=Staphylotrichum tortipilum TaxID=2831512 RepID=A0AAN6MBS5_9PEZI|nr:hypothetical protein C8A05DRAFT_48143 [Staphylotrichum longicolle]
MVGLRIVLVSPNDSLLWAFATVRAILPTGPGFADDEIFHPFGPAFATYSGLDANRVVVAATVDGQQRTIDCDTLVIATGSSCKEGMPFKHLAGTPSTKAEFHHLRDKITAARTIVVAGAGLTGVEVAGELGQAYGLVGTKEITLIADDELPLDREARPDVRQIAASELAKLNVKIIPNTRVVRPLHPHLRHNPNTAFFPPSLLSPSLRVTVSLATLQIPPPNIFALGDASAAQSANGKHADAQVRYLASALQEYLNGRAMPAYKPDDRYIFSVTMGPYRGTGQVGGRRLWGWVIRTAAGRHLGTDCAGHVARGRRTMTQTKW